MGLNRGGNLMTENLTKHQTVPLSPRQWEAIRQAAAERNRKPTELMRLIIFGKEKPVKEGKHGNV